MQNVNIRFHRAVLGALLILPLITMPVAAQSVIDASKENGFVSVTIKPSDAKRGGGRWRVDGGPWQKSRAFVGVSPGKHTVTFKSISDWVAPQEKKVRVTAGEFTTKKGWYTHITTDTENLSEEVTLETVWVPTVTFLMGRQPGEGGGTSDEDPQHQVAFSKDFFMSKYEITKGQWLAVMGTQPWAGQSNTLQTDDSPATHVSWNDAQAFTVALSNLTGKNYMLPTEAQWEYAARAGTTTRFHWGDDVGYAQLGSYAWYVNNTTTETFAHTVGTKQPNTFTIYDTSGNVWEWCRDWYSPYPSGLVRDPSGPTTGTDRVLRGGGWISDATDCRVANRASSQPTNTSYDIGFRVVRLSN